MTATDKAARTPKIIQGFYELQVVGYSLANKKMI